MPEMARLLGLTRSQVYQILRNPKYSHFFETIVIAEKKRITKENFQKFLEGQNQFHLDPANDYEELALGILHLMKGAYSDMASIRERNGSFYQNSRLLFRLHQFRLFP